MFSSDGEASAKLRGGSEGNNDTQKRALIRAEDEMLGASGNELRIPVAEAGIWCRIGCGRAAELLQERSGAPK